METWISLRKCRAREVITIKTNRWLIIGIILIAVGIVFLAVNQVIYAAKIEAYLKADQSWINNFSQNANSSLPTLEQFGLSGEAIVISNILGYMGEILIFVGAVSIVCFVLILISDRTKGVVTNNETKQNPSQTNTLRLQDNFTVFQSSYNF